MLLSVVLSYPPENGVLLYLFLVGHGMSVRTDCTMFCPTSPSRLPFSVAQGRAVTLQEISKRVVHSSEEYCVYRDVGNCQLQIVYTVL